jgi:thermitase
MRCLVLACLFIGIFTGHLSAGDFQESSAPKTSGRILAEPRAGVDPEAFRKWAKARKIETLRVHRGLSNLHVMRSPAAKESETIATLRASGLVAFAEPDYLIHVSVMPNDTAVVNGTAWALKKIGLPTAWDRVHSASNVIVAIVDSGIRATHEDLQSNLWTNPGEIAGNDLDDDNDGVVDDVHGFNGIDNSGDVTDESGHGTHVAGIIGAVGNNGKGSVGVAWQVQLMPLKFIDSSGEGATSDAVACIDYARTHGAQVINASWGDGASSLALRNAINRTRTVGIIFVAAAGNNGVDNDVKPNYPSSYPSDNIIAVAASDRNDSMASFSDYGATTVDLMAPGVDIYSTWNSSDSAYEAHDGTSMATPYVTGAVALLKARFPSKTYSELITAILKGADPISSADGKTSSGARLNVAGALNYLSPSVPLHLEVARGADGAITITAVGEAGAAVMIQHSIDLSAWNSFTAFSLDSSGMASTNSPFSDSTFDLFRAIQQ